MYFKKKLRDADKNIKEDNIFVLDSAGDAVVNIKAEKPEQIFSAYNFDSREKLNDELGDFIMDKAKFVPVNKDIRIKLYTDPSVDEIEVEKAIRNHFKKEYIEIKNEKKHNLVFSFAMLLLGLFSLAFQLVMHKFFYNVYAYIIVEIATWVFFWEAVDSYFLQRASLKRKSITLLKLYSAQIEVVKLKELKKISSKTKK